jgi:hypothetical protein
MYVIGVNSPSTRFQKDSCRKNPPPDQTDFQTGARAFGQERDQQPEARAPNPFELSNWLMLLSSGFAGFHDAGTLGDGLVRASLMLFASAFRRPIVTKITTKPESPRQDY